jgi:hypothetical protein
VQFLVIRYGGRCEGSCRCRFWDLGSMVEAFGRDGV